MKAYSKAVDYVKRNHRALQTVLLAGTFILLLFFIWFRIDNLLNSDISTQLVFSKFLRDEHEFLSKNWFYATELHVLGYNLVFEPLFFICSDWKIIRFLGQAELYLLLGLSICYFCRKAGLGKYYGIIAVAFFLPFSEQYFSFVLRNINYIPSLSISFLSLGMMLDYEKSENRKKKAALLVLTGALAFGTGLGGSRQLYITYAPAFLAIFLYCFLNRDSLEKSFRPGELERESAPNAQAESFKHIQKKNSPSAFFLISADGLIWNLLGYAVNSKLLAVIYDFSSYNKISWAGFQIDQLAALTDGLFQNLGMPYGRVGFSSLVHSCVCVLLVFLSSLALFRIMKRAKDVKFETIMIALFAASSFFISFVLYSFTTQQYAARYDLFWTVFVYPLLACTFAEKKLRKKNTGRLLAILVLGIGICSLDSYRIYAETDTTAELKIIVSLLGEEGYKNGYATMWQANIVTELSNGAIEIWDWSGGGGVVTGRAFDHGRYFDGGGDFSCVDELYMWAQKKAHVYEHPTEKVFWLLRQDQAQAYQLPNRLGEDFVIYRSDDKLNQGIFEEEKRKIKYVVYGFKSYDEMYSLIGGCHFSDTKAIGPGGSVRSNEGVLLYPDSYRMICTGENLSGCEADLTYRKLIQYPHPNVYADDRTRIRTAITAQGDDYLVIEFEVDEPAYDVAALLTNRSGTAAQITSIEITKKGGWYNDFYRNETVINGEDDHGTRTLHAGGVSLGPDITLVPGTYLLACEGSGLDQLTFDCVGAASEGSGQPEQLQIEMNDIQQSGEQIQYLFHLNDVREHIECRFFNPSGKDAVLTSMKIRRME